MAESREERSDVFRGVGQQVTIASDDDFLKIKETLTRIGIVIESNKLQQVCYILHKKGHYAIVHHKELLDLDGIKVEIDDVGISRRESITRLLHQWKLLSPVEELQPKEVQMFGLKVVPYREKSNWSFFSLYNIGRK